MESFGATANVEAKLANLRRGDWVGGMPEIVTCGEWVASRQVGYAHLITWWGDYPAGFVELQLLGVQPEGGYYHCLLLEEPQAVECLVHQDCLVVFRQNLPDPGVAGTELG